MTAAPNSPAGVVAALGPRTAGEVAEVTGGRLVPAGLDPETVVDGPVVLDSRYVEDRSLFLALPGDHVDGHDFAAQAVDRGAALVLATRETLGPDGEVLPAVVVDDVAEALGRLAAHHLARLRRTGPVEVVGVTGSVGKTTTKDLLLQVLSAAGPTVAPERSFNNEIGLPLTVLRADASTRFLVLEMGASGLGHIAYLTRIAPPDVAVVLRVGSAHVGEFGGVEAIATAKAEIVQGMVEGGTAVLNADDARVAAMADLAVGSVTTFGTRAGADVLAEAITLADGARAGFDLVAGDRTAHVQLGIIGEHHVTNALAAATVALTVGVSLDDVAAALSGSRALSPHRMHVVDRADGVTVLDDSYNANPDSMRAALAALVALCEGGRRAVAVLGEMGELGDLSRSEHEELGALVARLGVALTVVVGGGARPVADGAVGAGARAEDVVVVDDVERALATLDNALRPGDVVLVKSSNGAGLWRLADRLLDGPVDAGPVVGSTEGAR